MMRRHTRLIVSALATVLALSPYRAATADVMHGAQDSLGVQVRVDSAQKVVVVTAGPYAISGAPEQHQHKGASNVLRFNWPMDASLHGFKIEIVDGAGAPVPKDVLHHLIAVNFDRRQIAYPAVERLFGGGKETADVTLPGSLGVPLAKGTHLGMYAAWHNQTGKDIPVAYLKVTLSWLPPASVRRNVVMPLYVDVNNVIGGVTTYDLPPGKSSKSYDFTLPVSGRLIAMGGHLHDYGVAVRLEDAKTGVVLARLKANRTPDGQVTGVGRKIFGFDDDALRLQAGHLYRVVGEYDNPTDSTLRDGAMAHINGIFSPDDIRRWPPLETSDPNVQRDIAHLPAAGQGMMNHHHEEPVAAQGKTEENSGDVQHEGTDHGDMDHGNMDHGSMDDGAMEHGATPGSTAEKVDSTSARTPNP